MSMTARLITWLRGTRHSARYRRPPATHTHPLYIIGMDLAAGHDQTAVRMVLIDGASTPSEQVGEGVLNP